MLSKISTYVLFSIFILLMGSCCDCKNDKDEKEQIPALVGKMSWEDWKSNAGWKSYEANNFKIDDKKTKQLHSLLNSEYEFIVFSANWCLDSESEVPKVFKLMAEIGFDKITLYGVDRNKNEPTGEAVKNKIEKVPTVIILKSGKEIGRIVEFPYISWEEDLLTILEVQ